MPYQITSNKAAFLASTRKIEIGLVRYAARVAVGHVNRLMRDSVPTGRIYRSRTGTGYHQASAPGEPPAVDTKELVNSIAADVQETATGAEAVVGSNAYDKPVWRWLEFGTRRILPRPSARPAFFVAMEKIREAISAGNRGGVVEGTFGPEVR